MKFQILLAIALVLGVSGQKQQTRLDPVFEQMVLIFENLYAKLEKLKGVVCDLSRQVMLQQFFVEERIRSDGYSGLKLVRGADKGLKNYESNSYLSHSVGAIHDHSNMDRTIGMGEVVAVLNGVEFRTRHNDYKLVMPSTTSTQFHATEPIPFPEVPREVSKLETVQEQVEEMQEWFRAFSEQNATVRDYTKYFKPVLCYMEGAWTNDKEMNEPFDSDRHHIDATSWFDLQEKIRFSSYSGTKSRKENYAYLPTTIISVDEKTGIPNYAQWNYRILCQPLKRDIPTKLLRIEDDLAYRLTHGLAHQYRQDSRGARFKLFEGDRGQYELLDELFATVPGWDNIASGNLSHSVHGEKLYDVAQEGSVPLKTGYYHRWYKYFKEGAMGVRSFPRGFNDDNLWVAQTSQDRVEGMGLEVCDREMINRKRKKVCYKKYVKYTFAIPLEIIYMTPLLSWNPHNVTIHKKLGIADAGHRKGDDIKEPFNGVDMKHYYMTPREFFSGRTSREDPADTVRNVVHVIDQRGVMRRMSASGTRVYLHDIGGRDGNDVGKVRLRYPIAPIHGEGSSVWKELNALKDFVQADPASWNATDFVLFQMSTTYRDPPGQHEHMFELSFNNFMALIKEEKTMRVTTTLNQGHTHDLVIEYLPNLKTFNYISCGGLKRCGDGHPIKVYLLTTEMEMYL